MAVVTQSSKRKYVPPVLTSIQIDCSISIVMHSDEAGPPSGPFGVAAESKSIFPDEPFEGDKQAVFNNQSTPFD